MSNPAKRSRHEDGDADEGPEAKKARLMTSVDVVGGREDEDEAEQGTKLDPFVNPDVEVDPETGLRLGPKIRIRDGAPKEEEHKGILKWVHVHNTGKMEDLKLLFDLKDIISRQLPNMPRDYITRLVLDLNHASVIGVKNGKAIGGITFKCFRKKGYVPFIEIVFCAITVDQQVRGYGSRLMSHMKVWAQDHDYLHMMTYADDYAIGYFQRQGFTLEIELARKHWDVGFLKHYDSATLMHCPIDKRINYLEISEYLHDQRMAFVQQIRHLTTQHLIYPGITLFKERESRPDENHRSPTRIDVDSMPGLERCGYDTGAFKALLSPENQNKVKAQNQQLLDRILADENSWPFHRSVKDQYPQEWEKYRETVKDPTDLHEIGEKVASGFYITHQQMIADLLRMVDNAKIYNQKDSVYYKLADSINRRYLSQTQIEIHVPTSGAPTSGPNK